MNDYIRSPTSSTLAATVGVTLGTVTFEDPLTGSLTDVTSYWTENNCTSASLLLTPGFNNLTNDCILSNVTVWAHAFNNQLSLCAGAVRGIAYTINHNSNSVGTITSVVADVVLTDVYLTDISASSKRKLLDQSFRVSFHGASATTQTTDLGNTVRRYTLSYMKDR